MWEWSHTQEAYAHARAEVAAQSREWLEVVFAEWHAQADRSEFDGGFDETKYEAALAQAKALPEDTLADFIWDKMSEQAHCTNGGWAAHSCPYGCGCHLVRFSEEETVS